MKMGRIGALALMVGCTAPRNDTQAESNQQTIAADPLAEPRPEPPPEPAPPAGPGLGLERIASALADLEAVCELLLARECASLDDDECYCHVAPGAESKPWALPELGSVEQRLTVWYPSIRTTGGWTVFRPWTHEKITGIWGYYEDLSWDETREIDLLPGGEPELAFTFSKVHESADNASLPELGLKWTMQALCSREGAEARCTRALLEEFECDRSPRDGEDESYEARMVFGPNVVTISDVSGSEVPPEHAEFNPEVLVLTAGAHSLPELLAPP